MKNARSILVLFSLAVVSQASIGPVGQIVVSNVNLAPDGFHRPTVVANGQFPGPLVAAFKGAKFSLNVRDSLTNGQLDTVTSVHWHGLFQHNTQDADGPSFVTQCPLVPQESFDYQFSVPDQAGTYWYHSHYRNQYCDGLRGPLVIYDPLDPQKHLYDIDNEGTVITLADWYHYLSTEAGPVPSPNSTLINGKGRYAGGPNAPLSVINVVKGLRYRFRLVSISCDTNFIFSIDGHKFTVIEVDGVNHQPLVVDNVQIFAAQRYSLVMTANQPISNYWIRALPNNINPSFDNGMNSAILRYLGAPLKDPNTTSTANLPLVEQNLHPGSPVPGGADVNIQLDVSFNGTEFLVNGVPFVAPSVPVLLQILSGTPPASLMPERSLYTLPRNKIVEISIPGGVLAGPHPVHLHGHVFSVVRSAGNSTYNFANPPKRDTVSIGTSTNDNTTIRFVTDNPGPWFMHCHIDWHLNAGFAVVMAEDVPDIASTAARPKGWQALCPAYDKFISSTH
ncbi:yellow laccase [Vararia minispora EC-137]|uniref:Yellow laccase n=1 Tax=Vararia minispora EC-137 TaxID=1314806 RepID=A0ACB8QGR1_9AGAM|nr:yellow laccase [Vararia minispora EC-137]